MIRDDLLPRLKEAFTAALGSPAGDSWQIELDPDDEEQQTVLFRYPAGSRPGKSESRYLRPLVRLKWVPEANIGQATTPSSRLMPLKSSQICSRTLPAR